MTFNHRLVKHGDGSIGIYEVYYDEDDKIISCGEEAIIVGNDFDDLRKEVGHLNSAFDKTILTMNTLGEIK